MWSHWIEVCPLLQMGTTRIVSANGVVPRICPSVRSGPKGYRLSKSVRGAKSCDQ
jgi:hypothetical protein